MVELKNKLQRLLIRFWPDLIAFMRASPEVEVEAVQRNLSVSAYLRTYQGQIEAINRGMSIQVFLYKTNRAVEYALRRDGREIAFLRSPRIYWQILAVKNCKEAFYLIPSPYKETQDWQEKLYPEEE